MLKRGEVDVAYLLEGELGESIRETPTEARLSGGIGTFLSTLRHVGPESPADQRVRKAATSASRPGKRSATPIRSALPTQRNVVLKRFDKCAAIAPEKSRYDPVRRRSRCRTG